MGAGGGRLCAAGQRSLSCGLGQEWQGRLGAGHGLGIRQWAGGRGEGRAFGSDWVGLASGAQKKAGAEAARSVGFGVGGGGGNGLHIPLPK